MEIWIFKWMFTVFLNTSKLFIKNHWMENDNLISEDAYENDTYLKFKLLK